MPRTRRLIPVDAAAHIMCRGNNKQRIFYEDNDKSYFCFLLHRLKRENEIDIFHYCLMNNHFHLVVWLTEASTLPKFMKQLNLSYFNLYKNKYGYSGHLLQDRFKSNIIDRDTYLMHCGKYIELNPVRAGIVNSPDEYQFSSFNYYANGLWDPVITDNPIFLELSNSLIRRRKLYSEFVVDERLINSDKLKKQLFIGNQNFIAKLEKSFHIRNVKISPGRPRKQKATALPVPSKS